MRDDFILARRPAYSVVLVLLAFGLALSACNIAATQKPGTPSALPQESATPIPLEKQALPTLTNHLPATQTPGPIPLSESGPWLLFGNSKGISVLSNLDGSAQTSLNYPYAELYPAMGVSPRGGFLALCDRGNKGDLQLQILKIPQLEIVRKVPLLSTSARKIIEEASPPNAIPPVLASAMDPRMLRWSPDGGYLAFAGALDGPSTDVYLYELEGDSIRRLTSEDEQVGLMGWSPNGRWLVYLLAQEYRPYGEGAAVESVWAVDLDGEKRLLYSREDEASIFWEQILGWTSDEAFLVTRRVYEEASRALQEVNVRDQSVREMYSFMLQSASLSPENQTIFLSISPSMGANPPVEEGLYRLSLKDDELTLVAQGPWSQVEWIDSIGVFAAWNEDGGIAFTPEGKPDARFPESFGAFEPSPNGKWILIFDNSGLSLYRADGTLDRQITTDRGDVYWLSDSSGFYRIAPASQLEPSTLYLHLESGDWDPIPVAQGLSPYGGIYMIEP